MSLASLKGGKYVQPPVDAIVMQIAPPGGSFYRTALPLAPLPPVTLPLLFPGYATLASQRKIFIKQKVEMFEVITGFETANRYKVLQEDKKTPMFLSIEKSGCLTRQIFPGDCRPFEMEVLMMPEKRRFLRFRREFTCTLLCFNRPVLEVFDESKRDAPPQLLGKVKNAWTLCDRLFLLYDEKNHLIFRVNGRCCQCGLFFQCPCSPCNNIEFHIQTPDKTTVGIIRKEWSGCGKELFTDADNFSCEFPPDATPHAKAVILACVFLIDYMYFERKDHETPYR